MQYKHEDKQEVKEAIKFSKQERLSCFSKLKKRGIFQFNTQAINNTKDKEVDLLRERNQGNDELMLCGFCKGFFARSYMWHHKQPCHTVDSSVSSSESLPVSLLKSFEKDQVDSIASEILAKFRANDLEIYVEKKVD